MCRCASGIGARVDAVVRTVLADQLAILRTACEVAIAFYLASERAAVAFAVEVRVPRSFGSCCASTFVTGERAIAGSLAFEVAARAVARSRAIADAVTYAFVALLAGVGRIADLSNEATSEDYGQ
jgi:hypothetical protein